MTNIFILPASGSISSSISIVFDNPNLDQRNYYDARLEITSSQYKVSGSANFLNYTSIYIVSGSSILATLPIDQTNIIYLPTSSAEPAAPQTQTNYFLNYNFNPGNNITSSLNKFEIFNNTTSTTFLSASETQQVSKILLNTNNYYDLIVSGSGNYYDSNITIFNSSLNRTTFYTSSKNTYITASLFVSSSQPLYNYSVVANTTTLPYLSLKYGSSGDVPVSPSSSLEGWNTYLTSSAISVYTNDTSIDIVGGNLSSSLFNKIEITNQGGLINFQAIGLSNLISCSITNQQLRAFPTMSNFTNILYFNVTKNKITGSIPSIANNQSLKYFDIHDNNISGSISSSFFSQNLNLIYFDCSKNKITGSVPILPSDCQLEYFNCSQNQLSGSLSAIGASNLQYFDCSYNRLTGSLSLNAPNFGLQTFNCSNNKLSGILSASIFDYTVSLKNFDCSNNTLSGSLPEVSSSYSLENFYCYSNYFTGSLPQFTTGSPNLVKYWCSNNLINESLPNFSNSNLRDFICDNNILYGDIDLTGASKIVSMSISNNKFSGSLLTFEGCDSLQYFDYSYNHITGDIPQISNAPNLVTFKCTSNGGLQDYNYITDVFPVSLKYFYAYDSNIFKTSAIDGILYGLDSSGATNGIAVLDGASNASPSSPTGENYVTSLIGKGWSVSVNP